MQWIDKCLHCLSQSSIPVVPVLIDNYSTDGTREYIPTHYPDVVWLPQEKNLGFGQGNNVGFKYAMQEKADFVVLLNQDAYLEEHAIENMLAAYDSDSVLSPLHLTGDGENLDKNFKYYLYRNKKINLLDDLLIRKKSNVKYKIQEVNAACWMMSVGVLQKIGGFNPIFFHYGEDENYTQRLKYHNIPFYIIPNAFMRHDREEHGNMQVFNRNKVKREILRECCNINNNLGNIIIRLIILQASYYISDLPRHQYRIGSFIMGLFWILGHISAIGTSRKVDRNLGPNWL